MPADRRQPLPRGTSNRPSMPQYAGRILRESGKNIFAAAYPGLSSLLLSDSQDRNLSSSISRNYERIHESQAVVKDSLYRSVQLSKQTNTLLTQIEQASRRMGRGGGAGGNLPIPLLIPSLAALLFGGSLGIIGTAIYRAMTMSPEERQRIQQRASDQASSGREAMGERRRTSPGVGILQGFYNDRRPASAAADETPAERQVREMEERQASRTSAERLASSRRREGPETDREIRNRLLPRIQSHSDQGMARIILDNNLFTEAAAERFFRSRIPALRPNHPERERYENQFRDNMARWRSIVGVGSLGESMDAEMAFRPAVTQPPAESTTEEQQKQAAEAADIQSKNKIIELLGFHEYDEITFDADQIIFDGDIEIVRKDAAVGINMGGAAGGMTEPGGAGTGITPAGASQISYTPQTVSGGGGIASGAATVGGSTAGGPTQVGAAAVSPGVQQSGRGGSNTGSADEALRFFMSKGWSPAQAAGIVGNLQEESGFNPNITGDNGAAYGIAQWHAPRQNAFRSWAGRDIRGSSFQQQLEFVHYELTQGSERGAGIRLRSATTPEQAAIIVDQFYERSNGRARQNRIAHALRYAATIPQLQAGGIQTGAGLLTAGQNMAIGDQQQAINLAQPAPGVTIVPQAPGNTPPNQGQQGPVGEIPLNRRLLNLIRSNPAAETRAI